MAIYLCLVLESKSHYPSYVMILYEGFRMLNTLPTKIQTL